jgi:Leucine-rich repeat (LRR) protein
MNCVSSIPENIGDLEKLSFLSLPNNPNWTSLPSSVLDLPSILFVNLTNSNPTLPEGFNDRFTEEGGGNGRLFVRNMG